jgi:hypothetical protein
MKDISQDGVWTSMSGMQVRRATVELNYLDCDSRTDKSID